jgi:CO/xanthine dehydrogenase FAD-binding subunit
MTRSFSSATSVDDALSAMAGGRPSCGGGTDLVVGARQGKAPLPDAIVAIDRIDGLRAIGASDGGLRLGTLVTHGDLVANEDIRTRYTAIADASAIVGSHATRAQGTVGGNVMNASPAMDTGAPLLCFDATVTLLGGWRREGADDRPRRHCGPGPGKTSAAPDELLVAVDSAGCRAGTGRATSASSTAVRWRSRWSARHRRLSSRRRPSPDARIAITALTANDPACSRGGSPALVGTAGRRRRVGAAAGRPPPACDADQRRRGSAELPPRDGRGHGHAAHRRRADPARGVGPRSREPAMYGAKGGHEGRRP